MPLNSTLRKVRLEATLFLLSPTCWTPFNNKININYTCMPHSTATRLSKRGYSFRTSRDQGLHQWSGRPHLWYMIWGALTNRTKSIERHEDVADRTASKWWRTVDTLRVIYSSLFWGHWLWKVLNYTFIFGSRSEIAYCLLWQCTQYVLHSFFAKGFGACCFTAWVSSKQVTLFWLLGLLPRHILPIVHSA